MKIGIYTQPLSHNYGGILQNYALQQVLKSMGHTPITIYLGKYSYIRLIKDLVWNLKSLILRKSTCRKITSPIKQIKCETFFNPFIQSNISVTKRITKCTSTFVSSQHFDAIIVGSDQVWRPCFNDIYNSYLAFAIGMNIPKIAYAASFGVDDWEYTSEQTKYCAELVKQFNAISVREMSGIDLCKKYLNVDAINVLDPTLLLNKSDYTCLCQNIPIDEERFLLVYVLDEDEQKYSYIEAFAKQKGLLIKQIHAENKVSLSIEEWLALFRDAAYVVTDSFHGTVFSILYQKDFISLINMGRGASRFESLLTKLQLMNRGIDDWASIPEEQIDWSNVYGLLEEYRHESMQFLRNAIMK